MTLSGRRTTFAPAAVPLLGATAIQSAVVKTTARFDVPKDGDGAKINESVSLLGVAFARVRGISKVEYSTDGGGTWSAADLRAPLSNLPWVLWEASWTLGTNGAYVLKVRDGVGSTKSLHRQQAIRAVPPVITRSALTSPLSSGSTGIPMSPAHPPGSCVAE